MRIPSSGFSEISLLIVDDEKYNIMLLENLVKDMSVNIFASFSGKQALEIIENNEVDVVITNIEMPDLDGLQLISRIRENVGKDIYIIIVTALEELAIKVKGLELGANDYITKPFDLPELKSRIRIGIREALLKKELISSNRILEKREKELSHAIEEIKKNQAMLIQQGKMASLGILSAGIAHEINNPAAFINVNATTMEKWWMLFAPLFDRAIEMGIDRELGFEKLYEMRAKFPKMIQSLKEGVARISIITNALRTFALSDRGEKQWVDMNQIVEQALVMTKNRYKYHADLSIECDPQAPKIYVNFQKLVQVFVNLIINAADAIKEKKDAMTVGGEFFMGLLSIRIQGESTGGKISIGVTDNGIGMKADFLSNIFDPFFTTKHPDRGSGLGLSIVYGIIEDHNGAISVESKEGEGTTFTIILPVKENDKDADSYGRAEPNDYHDNCQRVYGK